MKKEVYLSYIRKMFAEKQATAEQQLNEWRERFTNSTLFGYYPPRGPLHLAALAAFLYQQDGDESLGRLAVEQLLRYPSFTEIYPQSARAARPEYEGVPFPPFDCAFDPILYSPAVDRLKPVLQPGELEQLGKIAGDSLEMVWKFPEWGGHNRAMLRAASLALCARSFPAHPRAAAWVEMSDELAEESWGRWSIEDAMMYQSHWLRALIQYAQARGKTEFSDFLQPRMHIKSMVQLLSPLGILPSYGDSHHFEIWEWLPVLEWGATAYRDPAMKWAAEQYFQSHLEHGTHGLHSALIVVNAFDWSDDSLEPAQPHYVPDALDDLVLKKIVFRTGWDKNSAYALLNYRDEGDYGLVARDYLRTNLAVSAEKMHHGHSDEGSLVMLVHEGNLLLNDGGYREDPPDGIYRADRFHNRLVWRPTVGLPADDPWEQLQDNGHYRAVRTNRLYQTHLLGAAFTRVRISDELEQMDWDRSIIFIPSLPVYLVVDSALAHVTRPRQLSQLWWTRQIHASGEDWYETGIDRAQHWVNQNDARLRIMLPSLPGQATRRVTHPARRNFQDEQVIVHGWRGEHRAGRSLNFVSLLVPHKAGETDMPEAQLTHSDPLGRGLGITLAWKGEKHFITVLNDLSASWLVDDIRPRYTFAQGRTVYGPVTTDAAFTYVRETPGGSSAGFLNGTRLEYHNQVLHQAPTSGMFQEDRSDIPGVPARFRWQGEFS